MAGLVLSREEIREVTGCARREPQRQHLDAMGIPYVVNAEGWPVVDRQAYYKAMGVTPDKQPPREAVLDFSAI